jgi:hypothetical protein
MNAAKARNIWMEAKSARLFVEEAHGAMMLEPSFKSLVSSAKERGRPGMGGAQLSFGFHESERFSGREFLQNRVEKVI